MTAPAAQIVVPVHDPVRPIERAVASVLASSARAGAIVVVHNTDPAPIARRLGALADDPRVRLLEVHDGVRSPAGPMNLGLAEASARAVGVLGSDDALDPGAVDRWLAGIEDGAAAVIARVRSASGAIDPSPPTRPRRRRRLDPVRDRLAYRSAPLGLVDRSAFGDLRFAEGLASGEDVAYSYRLWFSGERIDIASRGPGYRVLDDGGQRVTFTARSVEHDFAFLSGILDEEWFARRPIGQRRAIAVKLIRFNLFDAVLNRSSAGAWTGTEADALARVARRIEGFAPGARGFLSIADHRALERIVAADPTAHVLDAVRARGRYLHPAAVLPASARRLLDPIAPLRTLGAGALAARFA